MTTTKTSKRLQLNIILILLIVNFVVKIITKANAQLLENSAAYARKAITLK